MDDSIRRQARDVSSHYPDDWPPEPFFHNPIVSRDDVAQLTRLVEANASETEIDAFVREHPSTLSWCLRNWKTGHHASWIVSQQQIRPKTSIHGLKPDYLVAGKNSGGISWHVLELKAPGDNLFVRTSKNRLKFSETAHEGIFQLLEYIDYCASAQSYLRDGLGLKGFREPTGLLVIGRRPEFDVDADRQCMKAAWQRIAGDRLIITTFDALLEGMRGFAELLDSWVHTPDNKSLNRCGG